MEDTEGIETVNTTINNNDCLLRQAFLPRLWVTLYKNVIENKVFNADLRDEFSKYGYIQQTESEGFSVLKELYGGYF